MVKHFLGKIPKIRVFPQKIAQKQPEKSPILPFFKNRSLSQTRRSLSQTHRSLAETRRSFFRVLFFKNCIPTFDMVEN